MKDLILSNKKLALLFSIFPFLIIIGGLACAPKSAQQPNSGSPFQKGDESMAIEAAQKIFSEKRAAGDDMADGPCLADAIIPGWAADVAHSPRQTVDDLPVNQCQSFRDGKVSHFVELDTEGKFLRAY
jgi:hypothetical protein